MHQSTLACSSATIALSVEYSPCRFLSPAQVLCHTACQACTQQKSRPHSPAARPLATRPSCTPTYCTSSLSSPQAFHGWVADQPDTPAAPEQLGTKCSMQRGFLLPTTPVIRAEFHSEAYSNATLEHTLNSWIRSDYEDAVLALGATSHQLQQVLERHGVEARGAFTTAAAGAARQAKGAATAAAFVAAVGDCARALQPEQLEGLLDKEVGSAPRGVKGPVAGTVQRSSSVRTGCLQVVVHAVTWLGRNRGAALWRPSPLCRLQPAHRLSQIATYPDLGPVSVAINALWNKGSLPALGVSGWMGGRVGQKWQWAGETGAGLPGSAANLQCSAKRCIQARSEQGPQPQDGLAGGTLARAGLPTYYIFPRRGRGPQKLFQYLQPRHQFPDPRECGATLRGHSCQRRAQHQRSPGGPAWCRAECGGLAALHAQLGWLCNAGTCPLRVVWETVVQQAMWNSIAAACAPTKPEWHRGRALFMPGGQRVVAAGPA